MNPSANISNLDAILSSGNGTGAVPTLASGMTYKYESRGGTRKRRRHRTRKYRHRRHRRRQTIYRR